MQALDQSQTAHMVNNIRSDKYKMAQAGLEKAVKTIKSAATAAKSNNDPSKNRLLSRDCVIAFTFIIM